MRTAVEWPVNNRQSSPFTPTSVLKSGPGFYGSLSPSQRLPSGGALLSPDSPRGRDAAAPVTPRKKVSLPTTAHSWWCVRALQAALAAVRN